MLRTLTIVLSLGLILSGCARLADSRINPLNWFGRSSAVAVDPANRQPLLNAAQRTSVQDLRVPIEQIISLDVTRTATGALVRATGEAQSQGYFNAELVLIGISNGTATYEFRVEAPATFEATGSTASRRITVATAIDSVMLQSIQRVTVQGARNARTTSR